MIPAFAVLVLPALLTEALLEYHLASWEKTARSATTYSARFVHTKINPPFNHKSSFTGSLAIQKPNLGRMSIQNTSDSMDFSAYVLNERHFFSYDWQAKQVTQIPITRTGNSISFEVIPGIKVTLPRLRFEPLEMIHNFRAAEARKRFTFQLTNTDDKNYVYITIKPITERDRLSFVEMRLALYGPNVPKPYTPYLPAELRMKLPNGEIDDWKFTGQRIGVKFDDDTFRHRMPASDGWKLLKQNGGKWERIPSSEQPGSKKKQD